MIESKKLMPLDGEVAMWIVVGERCLEEERRRVGRAGKQKAVECVVATRGEASHCGNLDSCSKDWNEDGECENTT